MTEYERLRGALGVAEVVVPSPGRSWLSRCRPCKDSDTLGFALRTHRTLGYIEVVSSRTASLRCGDVILGVNGRLVLGETEAAVVALLRQGARGDVEAGHRHGSPTTTNHPPESGVAKGGVDKKSEGREATAGAVRLLIDTRHAWPATFFTRSTMTGGAHQVREGGEVEAAKDKWRRWRRLLCLLDGFDTIVLDAQVCDLYIADIYVDILYTSSVRLPDHAT